MNNSDKIFGLDVFRALAILFVVISNLAYFLDINNSLIIGLSGIVGFLGVEMFFILSGFLIGSILLKQLNNDEIEYKYFLSFFKRRWLRTLPSYIIVLILNIFLVLLYKLECKDIWKYFFFLQNFFKNDITFFKESWSLSIEEWSYLIIPLLLFLINKYVKLSIKVKFMLTIIFVILISNLFRFINNSMIQYNAMDDWNSEIKNVVLFRLDTIIYGFLVAWIYFYYKKWLKSKAVYLFIISIHLMFLQFVVLNVMSVTITSNPLYFNVFYFDLSAFSIMCFISVFIFWKKKFIGGFVFELISKISYPIYLLHYSLSSIILKYIFYREYNAISITSKLFFYILIVAILSFLLHIFIEKPFLKIRDKLTIS